MKGKRKIMDKIKAYSINDWKEDTDKSTTLENGKKLYAIVLGENLTTKELIVELMYEYVVEGILSRKYIANIDLHSTPPLIVTRNNRIVQHNNETADHLEFIEAILDMYDEETKMLAFNEFILNQNYGLALGSNAKKLKESVKLSTEENYNYFLLRFALQNQMEKSVYTQTDEERKELKDLSNGELYAIAADELTDTIKKEIIGRFICGKLK